MKLLIIILTFYDRNGWRGFVSCFKKVYWTQDIYFKNHGCDLISLKEPKGYWFQGTYFEWLEALPK